MILRPSALMPLRKVLMTGRSSCPECGTILRIRDRSFVGRRVNCPECKTTLRIETANDDGSYAMRRLTESEIVHSSSSIPAPSANVDGTQLPRPVRSVVSKWINSPLTAAWLLAIAAMALIAVLTLSPKIRRAAPRSSSVPIETPASTESTPAPEVATEVQPQPSTKPEVVPQEQPAGDVSVSVSALEPANIDGPLPWPPVPIPSAPQRPQKIDMESKMTAVRYPLYKQSKPIRRRDLLDSLQEQLGAKIYYDNDDLGAAGLDSTVTFELQNSTVGDVIKSVADGANWDLSIEDTGLRLTRKQPAKQ